MGDNREKTGTKGIVISIIFLIWFFGSLIAMIICSKLENSSGFVLALLGQYFLVFGIVAIIGNRMRKPFPVIVLLFPLVGVCLFVCGIWILVGGVHALASMEQYAPYILIWIFPIAGAVMVVSAYWKSRHLKRVCTQEIQAKCIDIESKWSSNRTGRGGKKVYMPVYSIFYNGEEKLLRNYTYTNLNHFEIGMYYYIKINPANPDEFLDDNNKKGNRLLLILGIAFIVVMVPAIVFM